MPTKKDLESALLAKTENVDNLLDEIDMLKKHCAQIESANRALMRRIDDLSKTKEVPPGYFADSPRTDDGRLHMAILVDGSRQEIQWAGSPGNGCWIDPVTIQEVKPVYFKRVDNE